MFLCWNLKLKLHGMIVILGAWTQVGKIQFKCGKACFDCLLSAAAWKIFNSSLFFYSIFTQVVLVYYK